MTPDFVFLSMLEGKEHRQPLDQHLPFVTVIAYLFASLSYWINLHGKFHESGIVFC